MMSPWRAFFLGGMRRSRPRAAVPALVALLPLCMPLSAPPAAAREIVPGQELIPLTALVRDALDERGLQGAVIEVDGVVRRHVTGEDGRAELSLPAGSYLVTVRKGGYDVLVGDLRVFEPGEFMLDMDRARDVDMRVPPKLLVRVVDGDTGNGIEGARVSIPDAGNRVTNLQGRTEFTELQLGVAPVSVEMIGYAERTEPVALHPDRTTTVEVRMSPRAIELEPIVVDVRSPHLGALGRLRAPGPWVAPASADTAHHRPAGDRTAFRRVLRNARCPGQSPFDPLNAAGGACALHPQRIRGRIPLGNQHRRHSAGVGGGGRGLLGTEYAGRVHRVEPERLWRGPHLDAAGTGAVGRRGDVMKPVYRRFG